MNNVATLVIDARARVQRQKCQIQQCGSHIAALTPRSPRQVRVEANFMTEFVLEAPSLPMSPNMLSLFSRGVPQSLDRW